jgi:hypothetical protein
VTYCFEPELTNIIVKVPIAWEGKVVNVPVVRGGKVEVPRAVEENVVKVIMSVRSPLWNCL